MDQVAQMNPKYLNLKCIVQHYHNDDKKKVIFDFSNSSLFHKIYIIFNLVNSDHNLSLAMYVQYCMTALHSITSPLCFSDLAPLGETTVEQWVNSIRNAPAPWAEMEFDNIILTLHSDFVRGLDRPDEVASMWNEIMRGIADLAAKPPKFPRKERFVADVQISHG